MEYASVSERKPTLTERASRALNYQNDLLERYYELAEVDGISDADKERVLELATDLKTHTSFLQNLMGKKSDSSAKETTKSDEDAEDDAFAEELTEGLSRKKAKAAKGEK